MTLRRLARYPVAALLLMTLSVSCSTVHRPRSLRYTSYNIQATAVDSPMLGFLEPYSGRLRRTMDDSLGWLPATLSKVMPDPSLGHFLADTYLAMARARFDSGVQVAFINAGGIRLNTLPAGRLRRGAVYEVMPFDNELVILRVTGAQLQSYLDHIAAEGGGGVSGLRMTIREGKAVDVTVQGRPLDPGATYLMANSDYTVLSGSYTGLRALPVRRTGYLLRDATIEYCTRFRDAGRPIGVSLDKRIQHVP
jgi:2',3'-cyclic-nucleotide 2'-phosphodiesterase (5'-nucleotidase family)